MNTPKELKYYKNHLWFAIGDVITAGLTDFAQEEMGDILFVDLPAEDETFSEGETIMEIESAKATEEFSLPFEITIVESNEELDDDPEKINEDAYGNWIVKFTTDADLEGILIDAEVYEELCAQLQEE